MSVKTMPLSQEMLDGWTLDRFFREALPTRNPPGKFYVIGRDYIDQGTPAGTLVLFHLGGKVVAHARLGPQWRRDNDDRKGHQTAVRIYILDDATVLQTPLTLSDLPAAWQSEWAGRFDQNPRTLDDSFEAEFLRKAR
jgi:hypothetical protein